MAGCGSGASPSAPTEAPQATVIASAPTSVSPRELADAKRFREDFGLRSDEPWIRQVATDPASRPGEVKYGVPLTPDEVSDLDRRTFATEAVKRFVVDYGVAHPADYAGAWIDQQAGGVVIAQFSANVEEHTSALFAELRPDAPVEVRGVRWSLAHLESEARRALAEHEWFATIPAVLLTTGVDEATNQVFVRISSFDAEATNKIERHFGWEGKVFVESDGTGALLLPEGTLALSVLEPSGAPASGLRCTAVPDMSGAYEPPAPAPTTDAEGRCTLQLPATGYWIKIETPAHPRSVLAVGRATVAEGHVSTVEIRIAER